MEQESEEDLSDEEVAEGELGIVEFICSPKSDVFTHYNCFMKDRVSYRRFILRLIRVKY